MRRSTRRISYKNIAAAMAAAKPGRLQDAGMTAAATYTWKDAVLNLADVLGAGNPKFNRERFLLASGVL